MSDHQPAEPVTPAVCPAPQERSYAEIPQPAPSRVGLTEAAAELLRRLVDRNGPVMFHQSGGCCDGSSPMCYPEGEFLTGDADVLLGRLVAPGLPGIPVWISRAQHASWAHTHLTIDAVPGRGGGFSLESPEGLRFLTRSRLLTDEERAAALPEDSA